MLNDKQMKKFLLLSLQVIVMLWALSCAYVILPVMLNYDLTTAYGLGGMVGVMLAFVLFASPGLYAAKVMFFSKRKA